MVTAFKPLPIQCREAAMQTDTADIVQAAWTEEPGGHFVTLLLLEGGPLRSGTAGSEGLMEALDEGILYFTRSVPCW